VFRYRDSTIADGKRYRIAPQAYLYAGRLGLLAEYVMSAQDVSRGAATANRLTHNGWQVAGSWYLTEDAASFTSITPRRPFDPTTRSWGAWEIVARWGELTLDSDAFPTFANPAASAQRARALGVGLNWHLARGVQLGFNYEETRFTGGATGGDRAPERFFVTRIQQAF
jgi:phosphate-selective porin OprO/OprP